METNNSRKILKQMTKTLSQSALKMTFLMLFSEVSYICVIVVLLLSFNLCWFATLVSKRIKLNCQNSFHM